MDKKRPIWISKCPLLSRWISALAKQEHYPYQLKNKSGVRKRLFLMPNKFWCFVDGSMKEVEVYNESRVLCKWTSTTDVRLCRMFQNACQSWNSSSGSYHYRRQLPLRLAWTMTIHKLPKAVINLGDKETSLGFTLELKGWKT